MTNNLLGSFGKPAVPDTPMIIGKPKIIYDNIEEEIESFFKVYKKMPIKDNTYGMHSPHLFLMWHALRQINPTTIIESGVYKGLGTWWMRQACPNATIYSIDVDLSNVEYIDNKATYLHTDFKCHKWDEINDKANALIFFDDHQNALERLKQMKWMGFSMAMFEDNYASYTGDCYSCKKILAQTGNQWAWDIIEPNSVDCYSFNNNILTYQELPAPFRMATTRFGFEWKEESLFATPKTEAQRLLFDEAKTYTYMCFVELKR